MNILCGDMKCFINRPTPELCELLSCFREAFITQKGAQVNNSCQRRFVVCHSGFSSEMPQAQYEAAYMQTSIYLVELASPHHIIGKHELTGFISRFLTREWPS